MNLAVANRIKCLDRALVMGIAGLLVFSPLAIGSVNPWAFCTIEATVFLLTALWMGRLAIERGPQAFPGLLPLLAPVLAFFGLIILQLIPLPPGVEHLLSPATYSLYETSLPGWPQHDFYRDDPRSSNGIEAGQNHLPLHDASVGASLPGAPSAAPRQPGWIDAIFRWRPLSIAPTLTGASALKLMAYACLFFLILYYPFREYPQPLGERRFYRRLLKLVLIMGLVVGALGLLGQAFWNGAVLWVYVPYDWGAPMPGYDARAAGPFVNPNHFAAYLNLILPLALACALFETFLSRRRRWRNSIRVFCLAVAVIAVAAIALSLSRGGWLGGFIAVSMVIWAALIARWRDQGRGGVGWRAPGVLYVVFVLCVIVGSALYTAPGATTAVGERLQMTIEEPDFYSRLGYWRDSIPLIRDFPLFGVGLGCFQELFPRYQSPPWMTLAVREAHNDYIELVAETGVAGLALLVWFCLAAGTRIYRGLLTLPSEVLPIAVALIAGLCAMAFQEFFDFALQVPANAVLFTILLALALRICGAARGGAEVHHAASGVRPFAAGIAVAAIVLIGVALNQNRTPYPYLAALPYDAQSAQSLIRAHPARSIPHVWYAEIEHASAANQTRELAIAAALEPNNPLVLDRYAQSLAAGGHTEEALAELTRSIYVFPSMAEHFYLQSDMIPWLSIEERRAIAAGFQKAIAHDFDGASSALAAFWEALHHDAAAAEALTQASSAADQPSARAQLLIDAGVVLARAGETLRAAAAFKQAALIQPNNPKPYEYLVSQVLAPRKDLDSARVIVEKAIENGADPFPLYVSLARVYEQLGDFTGAEAALLQAAKVRPGGRYDYDTLMRLADLEIEAKHFGQAAFWMRQAIELRPGSPEALYQLALVEETDYEYGPALRDLARGLSLAPDDTRIRKHYREMLRMIAAAKHNQ